jgi:hypothetical protein
MYRGVVIKDMRLGDIGWGLMVGWTIWVVVLPVALEAIDFKSARSKKSKIIQNEKDNPLYFFEFQLDILLKIMNLRPTW